MPRQNLENRLTGVMVIAGVILTLTLQNRANSQLRVKGAAARMQQSQLAYLAAEHARLSRAENRETASSDQPRPELPSELQQLRNMAQRLTKQTNELEAKLKQAREVRRAQSMAASAYPPGYDYNEVPGYNQQRHAMASGKHDDAMSLAMAIARYAPDHSGEITLDLDRLAPYLQKYGRTVTGTNEFEIVHEGTLDRATNFPSLSVAVLRERQPWRAPSGRWARVYGMANGGAQIVESIDNFQAWEAEHIIPP